MNSMDDKKLEELKDEAVEEVAGGIAGIFPNAPSIGEPPRPSSDPEDDKAIPQPVDPNDPNRLYFIH